MKKPLQLLALGAATVILVGCAQGADTVENAAQTNAASGEVVKIAVHDSFPNEKFAEMASAATGHKVEVVTLGGEELPGQLVLSKEAPVADAFFGVNNYYASQLVNADVLEPYQAKLPAGAEKFVFDDKGSLTPITDSTVCMNSDPAWFKEKNLAEPETYADLLKPEYKDLAAVIDPHDATGIAFLAGTISEFGEDGYLDYWKQLRDNGAKIEAGWSDAYYGQFTQGGEGGQRPLVLSYASSPAYTVNEENTETSSRALLETCSSVIEYAGVLKGAKNPEGAKQVLDYMLSDEFQSIISDEMYVYPVSKTGKIPAVWEKFAPIPTTRHDLDAAEIDAKRETWLRDWDAAIKG